MTAAFPNSRQADVQATKETVSNIVLPLDGTEASRTAIPIAQALTELFHARTHLLYVGEEKVAPGIVPKLLRVPVNKFPGIVVHPFERTTAAETILRVANELPRSLIVMCTHTGHPRKADRFGSVTESVLTSRPERILLLGPERGYRDWSLRRMLLAHDGKHRSMIAAAAAISIARVANSEVTVLHVACRGTAAPKEAGSYPAPQYLDQPQHEWPAWAGEFMDRIMAVGVPTSSVHFQLSVMTGLPGSEVAEVARKSGADVVVMGIDGAWEESAHRRVRTVLRGAGCPVMLMWTPEQKG